MLEYPKFRLQPDEREILLGEYLPWCEVVDPKRPGPVPQCRDAGDRIFLELALAAKADFLVTGDGDLLSLEKQFAVPIVTAERFRTQAMPHPPGVAERSAAPLVNPRRKRAR